jgi:hypothetical protein
MKAPLINKTRNRLSVLKVKFINVLKLIIDGAAYLKDRQNPLSAPENSKIRLHLNANLNLLINSFFNGLQ